MESALQLRYNLAFIEQLYKHYLDSVKKKHRNTIKNYLSDLRSFYYWFTKNYKQTEDVEITQIISQIATPTIYEYRQFLIDDAIPQKTSKGSIHPPSCDFDET